MSELDIIEAIEDNCLDSYHAVRYSLIEDRACATICSKCQEKIDRIGEEYERNN